MASSGGPGSLPMHTLLFTDLVDSTSLVQRLGDERAAALWAEHDRQARALLVGRGGIEVDRSDGFFLLFDAVADAARFALDYHQALAGLGLSARIGIHTGAVTQRENRPEDVARGAKRIEIEGLAKPFAARVMALAGGGQTLLSSTAHAALAPALPPGHEMQCHGHYRLKGIEEPQQIFELGLREHPFMPPPDTEKVYRVVCRGELWSPLREVRHNLAPERDAFIGRRSELRHLARMLDGGARLLTLLGPGGTGKTRIARRYGLAWLGDWPGGVYFCDLSEARSEGGIHYAVAQALGVPLGASDAAARLGHAIASRGRCLLILDNFEQVVECAAASVGRWVDRAVAAAFVVTSRERLQLPGEQVLPIEPMAVASEAVELFTARAQAQRPEFALDGRSSEAVEAIVRLLDGLPLAIELAAARIRVLSAAQIVDRLKDRFRLLAGARGAAARQATLRAAIDWSWDLLSPWEQAALAQCSVFEGGFTLDAAEAVIDQRRWPAAPPAMDTVQALVDKSLLRTWLPGGPSRWDIDEPYFGMYLSIREYAAEKCRASGPAEAAAAEQRHGRWFAGFGSAAAIESLSRPGGLARGRALALELDNLAAACRRAMARRDDDCAVAAYLALAQVLTRKGPYSLGVELGRALAALPALAPPLLLTVVLRLADSLQQMGQVANSRAPAEQALALAEGLGDGRLQALALERMGLQCRFESRLDEARLHLEPALQKYREAGDTRREASVLAFLGLTHREQGRVEQAREQFEQALALQRAMLSRWDQGNTLGFLAVLHAEQGRFAQAQAGLEEALAIWRDADDRVGEGEVLNNLGCLEIDRGRLAEAAEFLQQALQIHREVGSRRWEGYVIGDLGRLHLRQRQWAAARECLDQALAITREAGDRRTEGAELRSLAELFLEMGNDDMARRALDAAEPLLREIGDKHYLGLILCGRAELLRRGGELVLARQHFAEARALAQATQAGPQSELGGRLAAVRLALEPAAD